MKYLDNKFKDAKKEIKEARALKKLFANPTFQKKVNDLYNQYFVDTNTYPESDWDFSRIGEINNVYGKDIDLCRLIVDNEKPYEELVDKATEISWDNQLIYPKKWSFKFGEYTVYLRETFYADIPEEDLLTLEALGKVEVTYHEARKESRIFCSN